METKTIQERGLSFEFIIENCKKIKDLQKLVQMVEDDVNDVKILPKIKNKKFLYGSEL